LATLIKYAANAHSASTPKKAAGLPSAPNRVATPAQAQNAANAHRANLVASLNTDLPYIQRQAAKASADRIITEYFDNPTALPPVTNATKQKAHSEEWAFLYSGGSRSLEQFAVSPVK
jgi:type IV secretory pathway VirJ component